LIVIVVWLTQKTHVEWD